MPRSTRGFGFAGLSVLYQCRAPTAAGDVLTTPCSFAPPQGEDNGMEVEQLDKCVPDTVCINKPGSILTGSMPHAIEEPASRRHAENTQALGLEGCQAEAVSGTEAPRTLTEGQPRDEMLQIQPSNEVSDALECRNEVAVLCSCHSKFRVPPSDAQGAFQSWDSLCRLTLQPDPHARLLSIHLQSSHHFHHSLRISRLLR